MQNVSGMGASGERAPREKKFEVDERLANKHIQTLQFVQEVVTENKLLKKRVEELEENEVHCDELHRAADESKAQIKIIQEQYLRRADEINAMMAEKHRTEMMVVVQEKLTQEQKYSEEIIQLKGEIIHLEAGNKDMTEKIQMLSGSNERMEVLHAEIGDQKRIINDLNMEVEALRSENEQLSGEKTSQFSQLQSLQAMKQQNESLAQDLKELANKNVNLAYKVTKLEDELKEASNVKDQVVLIDNLKNKLGKLHKERSVAVEKEEYYQKQIGDLTYQLDKMQEALKNMEDSKDRVLQEYYKVLADLNSFKKHHMGNGDNKNFKEFVKLKREVGILKDENQKLKTMHNSVFTCGNNTNLPMLRFECADRDETRSLQGSRKSKPKKPSSATSEGK